MTKVAEDQFTRKEGIDYFFIDYHVERGDFIKWVRKPNCIEGDVVNRLLYSEEGREVTRFRVQSENDLSHLHESWDETNQKWVFDFFTKRERCFGNRYERAEEVLYGGQSLSRGWDGKTYTEPLEDWKERVRNHPFYRNFFEDEHYKEEYESKFRTEEN